MRNDGHVVYYTIEHKSVGRTPHNEPDKPFIKEKNPEWHGSSWDHFGVAFCPKNHYGHKNYYKYPKEGEDSSKLWQDYGFNGWRNLKHAIAALLRARKINRQRGWTHSHDGRIYLTEDIEFRIVKIETSQKTDVVSCEDVIDCITN